MAIKKQATDRVSSVLAEIESHASPRIREEMGPRYGVFTDKAFGVAMSTMKRIGKDLGRDHELALALWDTGWYEARIVACFVDEPARVTAVQMDRWCRDFDNWGICDTVCFHLFDRTPHAFGKVEQWARRRDEFVKRAAFALLACLAAHDKAAGDAAFLRCLPLIEQAATDERNFVKKGVSWGLRMVGRRNAVLNAASVKLAQRLVGSDDATSRWLGKAALKELTSAAVTGRLRRAK